MDSESSAPLERSVSQQSATSVRSQRSSTVRGARRAKLASQPSSSASSIAPSDKSLTSFPSFSPESPRHERFFAGDEFDGATLLSRRSPNQQSATTLVDSLTTSSPRPAAARGSLFEDSPLAATKIPGALHLTDDVHIERLVAKHGAVRLVRQIAEDLAQRDAQLVALRRKADARERALRKIILECGLSTLDLETRLRAVELESKSNGQSRRVVDLMSDAMTDDALYGYGLTENDATIRASSLASAAEGDRKGTAKGWKEYLWGGTSSRKSSQTSSVNGDEAKQQTVVRSAPAIDRRPTLQEDLFTPPEGEAGRTSSRASSVQGTQAERKASSSIASLALRLVAGGAQTVRDGEVRGRAGSAGAVGSLRTSSASSNRTSASARVVSSQGGPRALMAMRRNAGAPNAPPTISARTKPQERLEPLATSPADGVVTRQESYGPVEMDTILPPEIQPPTLTHIYNNYQGAEYLTDRFGFIYDQRRKKRQREASLMAQKSKGGAPTEMLTNGRSAISPVITEDSSNAGWDVSSEGRPDTPSSTEAVPEEGKPKRWQDFLKIATFPTELLSHMPAMSMPGIEVTEGADVPKSPGFVNSGDRGFVPPASTTAALDSETVPVPETEPAAGTLVKEDAEPVKLLLEQLSELHDNLQRERTVRWNEFLRKVRAERKREGEVANATAAAAAEARFQKATAMMPETRLADGEIIGVADLGNKGKLGRNKWNEFRSLVLGGVPVLLRSKVWAECSGANSLRVPGYFDDLMARPADEDNADVAAQIRADIHRTLTDNIFFRKGPGVTKLNEVLLAYARRNPDVGYCQGMNLITANLLLIAPSAEDAFWLLTSMVESILPVGYYDHSLLASRADQQVLRAYVAEVLPRLSAHFDDLAIDLETMTFQWFLSVFTDCLSAEALFRVWDVVLCSSDGGGGVFLFQVALALLKLNEPQLLACDGPAAVYTYINHQMTNHAISIDGLVQASEGLRRVVRREDVEARRLKAVEAEREVVRAREERNAAYTQARRGGPGTPTPTVEAAVAHSEDAAEESGTAQENDGAEGG